MRRNRFHKCRLKVTFDVKVDRKSRKRPYKRKIFDSDKVPKGLDILAV